MHTPRPRLALAAVAALALTACSGLPVEVAARVGGATIATDQVERLVTARLSDPGSQVGGLGGERRIEAVNQLQRSVLTDLIRLAAIEQIAAEQGLTASPEEVEEAWQEQADRLGGEQALRDRLAAAGLTEEEARQRLAALILQQRLRREVGDQAFPGFLRDAFQRVEVTVNQRFGRFRVEDASVVASEEFAPGTGEREPAPGDLLPGPSPRPSPSPPTSTPGGGEATP